MSLSKSSSAHSKGFGAPTRDRSPKKARRINLDLILDSTSLTRSTKETNDAYLSRVTHLHLQNKRIKKLEGLELCTNLKVLYLYDNQIEVIENLNFAGLLQYLYLQNNSIKEIPRLNMPNLKKLFLDDNEISAIAGLQECYNLEELTLSRQRLPTFTTLQFDENTMQTLSRGLQVLDLSGNGLTDLSPFASLYNLRKFVCKDNAIVEISEVERIVGLPRLEEANFKGNPCSSFPKYRDVVIGASSENFNKLDDIDIPKHQQVAVKGLMKHRRAIGVMGRFQPSVSSASVSFHPQEMQDSQELYGDEE